MHTRRGFRLSLLASVIVSAFFAACGDDESPGSAGTGAPDGATPDASVSDTSTSSDAPTDTTVDAGPDVRLPLQGPVGFSSVYGHTCALRDGGTVSCWGWNPGGALGSPSAGAQSATPVTVEGLTGPTEIAAGGQFTCALRSDRTVGCWGSNGFGQLGVGAVGAPSASVEPLTVLGLANVRAVAAGYLFACAVKDDRSVSCWGRNDTGALGTDAGASSGEPVAVPGIANAELIAAGATRACVVHVDRTVSCWGANAPAAPVTGVAGAVALAVGFSHACALREDRSVVCWGGNDQGQLGPGTTAPSSAQAVPITGLTDVVAIGAGYHQTCAVRAGGGVVCWGGNGDGALGSGDAAAPFSATPANVAISDAVTVRGGLGFACARRVGEKVSCWGSNSVDQLGGGTDAGSSASPVEVVGF